MNKTRYVIDTTGLISYFSDVFREVSRISQPTLDILNTGILYDDAVLLTVPSIVFVEIFDKWFRGTHHRNEEFRAMFLAEVFNPLQSANNVEIRGMDFEIIEAFLSIDDAIVNLENHDKIVIATAIVLEAPLITSDTKIKDYVREEKIIPKICD